MFDYLMGALNGTILANFLVLLIGGIAAIAAGIVLHAFVFGPKAKSANPGKLAEYANGKRFLPLAVIKVTYYAVAVYLVFMGVSQCIMSGYSGINGILQYTILGNVILRIAYEAVLAVRKNAGLDTENNTADEPKVNQPLIQPKPQPQYQQPQQPQQYQPYQQPASVPVQQPAAPYQQPASVPVQQTAVPYQQPEAAPVPQPAAYYQQPAPAPVQQSVPAPVPQTVPVSASVPQSVPQPAPIPQPVPEPVQQTISQPAPVPQPVPAPVQPEQQVAAPAALICSSCGKELKSGAKFCPFCGKPTV